jgi:hypothetical protein
LFVRNDVILVIQSKNKINPIKIVIYPPNWIILRLYFLIQIPYKKNRSNAFVEELDNLDGKYLDEEFFFSLLISRGLDIVDVRWVRCTD